MLNDYRQIVSGLKNTPWLITQESLEMILEIVNMRLNGEAFSDDEIRIRLEEAKSENRDNPRVEIDSGVGVLSLVGPLFPKANLMTELSGATSLEEFRNDLRGLVENDAVEQIVMDVDSPGGSSFMVAETGNAIREARDVKPIYAVANTVAASAALWLASQATKFYATDSGKVGSLGVYTVHEDWSGADKNEGRKVTLIYAGDYKTVGNEHEPLSAEAKEYIQEQVDETMEDFIGAVAEGRGLSVEKVRNDFGNAKVFNAKKAHEIGMIDGVLSLDDVLESLVVNNSQQRTTALATAVRSMHSGGDMLMAEGGKGRIRTLLARSNEGDDIDVRVEHAPQEHDDPPNKGEGAPTNQTTPDRALGDEGGDGGSRRDTPPIAQDTEGGNVVNEFMVALCERLGLDPEEVNEEEILVAAQQMRTEVEPLRQAAQDSKERKTFAEQFPEEYERMQKLEVKDRESEAKAFASRYERLTRKEGEKDIPTTHGFSALTLDNIEKLHMGFADGTVRLADFEEFLASVANTGLVDYSERGSSRTREREVTQESGGKAFSELVAEIQDEDKLPYKDAVALAAKKYPDEFAAYRAEARPERR